MKNFNPEMHKKAMCNGRYMPRYFRVTGTKWGSLFPTTVRYHWDAYGIADFLTQPYIRDQWVHIDSVVEYHWSELEEEEDVW
jgi:hypothetical protein